MPADLRQQVLANVSRRSRFSIDPTSAVSAEAIDARLTERLRESAEANSLPIREARAAVSDQIGSRRGWRDGDRGRRFRALILSVRLADGSWFNGRLAVPRPDPWLGLRLAASTLLLYFFLLAAMIWIAARLARPLRNLTAAADRFQGRGEAPQVEPTGPADLRRAILAFNAMSARVSAMLDEKDRMLGAIGHDMRTPLASLRIRAESVEPEEERQRMIATIEEMTAMLDDTLALARTGRAGEKVRPVDLQALADAVVEEFRALGHDVEMVEGDRQTAPVQPNLLRRALRNLIDNGVKYGGAVKVAVRIVSGGIALRNLRQRARHPRSRARQCPGAFRPPRTLPQPRNRRLGPRPRFGARRGRGAWRPAGA